MPASKYAAAHAKPEGPNDARPTAIQILKDENLLTPAANGALPLSDKVFLVTGGASGIGYETTRALYAAGAHVFITVRDRKQGTDAVEKITSEKEFAKNGGKIEVLNLHLDSLKSVRECAEEFKKKSSTLNVLITNAGVMACPQGKTVDGFETQFGTNHLGHFLFFELLKPTLLASSKPDFNSRVVTLSSSGHRSSPIRFDDLNFTTEGSYHPFVAYGQSKTANIYMALEIERRYGSKGLHANALMPGGIITPLQRHVMDANFEKMLEDPIIKASMKSPPQGAATTIWAAVSKEWEGKGGKYLEDVAESPSLPNDEAPHVTSPGYKSYAYDAKAAEKLYNVSLDLVGLKE